MNQGYQSLFRGIHPPTLINSVPHPLPITLPGFVASEGSNDHGLQMRITSADWGRLLCVATVERIEQPRLILRRGEVNTDLFVLLDGHAQMLVDERTDVVDRFAAGEFIGEMGFLDGIPSAVKVVAETGAQLARLDGQRLRQLLADDTLLSERLHRDLARQLARRLRRTIGIAREVGTVPVSPPPSTVEPIRIDQYCFRQLWGEAEVEDALALLHDVYVEEQGWRPLHFNPSRVRVEQRDGRRLLVDRHVKEAHWFGAFVEEELVGCFRVLPYPYHELRHYLDVPPFLNRSYASELNRLALRPAWRQHQIVLPMLLQVAFEHALRLSLVVYVTAPQPEPAGLFARMGMKSGVVPPFRYNTTEGEPVELLYFDATSDDPSSTQLYKVANRMRKRNRLRRPTETVTGND